MNVVYGYDANGNITSANNRTFTYDLSNRLIKVEDNGVTIADYVYNALNQRIKKILPGETRIFHYDFMGHLIAETNPSGQNLVEYFYLGDQPLAMIRPGEALYYYHNDHLGTPQILTDDTGTVSWKAVYGPFGEAEIAIATVENSLRFPGQYYDQETGLHYNWNRYYEPKTGRYLIPDPIGLEGGINLFVYVVNNPTSLIDQNGLAAYYCLGQPRDYYHAYICVNNKCAGLMPLDLWGKGVILPEKFNKADCDEIKFPNWNKCCDQGKFEKCVENEIDAALQSRDHYYYFPFYTCLNWASDVIFKCFGKACK